MFEGVVEFIFGRLVVGVERVLNELRIGVWRFCCFLVECVIWIEELEFWLIVFVLFVFWKCWKGVVFFILFFFLEVFFFVDLGVFLGLCLDFVFEDFVVVFFKLDFDRDFIIIWINKSICYVRMIKI